MRPRLLDLFCGAGGAAVGYHRAGFEVVGIDKAPQKNYPFEFYEGDALDFLRELSNGMCVDANEHGEVWLSLADFVAIHASPPCQKWTGARNLGNVRDAPDLVTPLRPLLVDAGLPYVIENVPGAPLLNPIQLCGSSFGLDVRRHRLFESNVPLLSLPCQHYWQTPRFPPRASKGMRSVVSVFGRDFPASVAGPAMGIDWMTNPEMGEAIPPAYTEHIGGYLLSAIERKAAA
jgi:DNA (cytosine-5)-methyltransferase 1